MGGRDDPVANKLIVEAGPASQEAGEPRIRRLLRRLRLTTQAALWTERALAALWPALGVAGGFVCLALLGLPQSLPLPLHLALLVAFGATLLWAAWRSRKALRWPGRDAADRRLERAAGLAHRPLAVLTDRLAAPDRQTGSAPELWRLHQRQALAQLGRLRVVWPAPSLPTRDPRAMRLLLLLGLTIAVAIAGPDATERLVSALTPRLPPGPAVLALEIRAWMTPPGYTGLPPALLPDGGAVSMPAGSRITVSLSGGKGGPPSLQIDTGARRFEAIGADSFQAQAEPRADGTMVVERDGNAVASWTLTLRPDLPPVVSWAKPPSVLRGRLPRVRLSWKATHAYGVTSLAAQFRLRDRPAVPPLDVAIPLNGRPREAAGTLATDLTAHPWAGLPVTVVLSGRDGAGLVGTGEAAALVLPARRFVQPGAQALVAVRQMLALAPEETEAAATALRQAATRAELWPQDDPAPSQLRDIAAALQATPATAGSPDAAVAAAQPKLWALALRLEEGTALRAAEALRRAQQELRAALDKAAPPELRNKPEIERRAEALARAMQRHQQALAEQAKRSPGSATPVGPRDSQAAEQKLQQLRDAAQADRMDEARERMAELDAMLDQARKSGRSEAQRKRDEGRRKGRAEIGVMQDLIRRQAAQIDHAEARLSAPAIPDPSAQRDQDRAVQMALRRVLGEVMQQHGDLTGSVPKNLGEADAAMRDAAAGLADGHDDIASAAALRAVQALQEGGQAMGQQLAKQFGRGQDQQGQDGSGQEGQGQDAHGQDMGSGRGGTDAQDMLGDGQDGDEQSDGADEGGSGQADDEGDGTQDGTGTTGSLTGRHRDPFGRATQNGQTGSDGGRDTKVPEEMERNRGRAVQDELRRREAQRTRPKQELDYIDRLLKSD